MNPFQIDKDFTPSSFMLLFDMQCIDYPFFKTDLLTLKYDSIQTEAIHTLGDCFLKLERSYYDTECQTAGSAYIISAHLHSN